MISRLPVIGLLVFAAVLIDVGRPVWMGETLMVPSLLDLALLGVCLTLAGGEAVFWGGLIGLLQDDLTGQPLGLGIMSGATLAWIGPHLARSVNSNGSLLDRAFLSCLLVLILGLLRVVPGLWHNGTISETLSMADWISLTAARLAMTLLVLLLCQGIGTLLGLNRFHRSRFSGTWSLNRDHC